MTLTTSPTQKYSQKAGQRFAAKANVTYQFVDYTPRGACKQLFSCRDREVVLSGPAGTGKSRACIEKINWVCEKYPNTRAIMVRKTRKSLTQTAMVTFEREVQPHPTYTPFNSTDQEYRYPNGSIMAVGGMDDPKKILSSQWDIAYAQQAEELDEQDWQSILTRMRNQKVPYQQLLGDVNPDAPEHWIKARADVGKIKMLESRHEDNPRLWDAINQKWTDFGITYIAALDSLTGALYKRLRLGLWASAEGAVYEEVWDKAIHLIDHFEIPMDWPRYWGVDFGYTNPFTWGAYAEDPDGRLYLYKEIYKTKTLVEDHAQVIRRETKDEPKPRAVICDHDAEDRATLERHLGITTIGAWKFVSPGIQAVTARLRKAGDGKPRIFYLRDSLVEVDQNLAALHQPTSTVAEFESYVWDTSNNRKRGEEPVKKYDHGCLVAGTSVVTMRGGIPIEQVIAGDFVATRQGWRKVLASGITSFTAEVYKVVFSDGRVLVGTGNHPVWVDGRGFTSIDSLSYNDSVCDLESSFSPHPETVLSGSVLTELSIIGVVATDSLLTRETVLRAKGFWRKMFGSTIEGLFRKAVRSIIKTEIKEITDCLIWSCLLQKSIAQLTEQNKLCVVSFFGQIMESRCWMQRLHGIDLLLEKLGILVQQSAQLWDKQFATANALKNFVSLVVRYLQPFALQTVFAQGDVVPAFVCNQEWTTQSFNAKFAERFSSTISTLRRSSVHVAALRVFDSGESREFVRSVGDLLRCGHAKLNASAPLRVHMVIGPLTERVPVHNLTVENTPEYFANGILTHNCDVLRYIVTHIDKTGSLYRAPFTNIGGAVSAANSLVTPSRWRGAGSMRGNGRSAVVDD